MTPLPLLAAASIYWHFPVLLVTFSLVYSATRHDRWDRILREAVVWGRNVGVFLALVGVALWVGSSYPDYWPYLAAVVAGAFAVSSVRSHLRGKATPAAG